MESLNRLSGHRHKRYLFPNGARIVIRDGQIRVFVAMREIDKDPWLYEEIRSALSYDRQGELVVVVSRLTQRIREELGRLTFVGARLYSSLLGGNRV